MNAKKFGPVAIALSLAFNLTATAQNYYIVVGTFSSPHDANEFTSFVNTKVSESDALTKDSEMHIYVLQTANHQEAESYREHLQKEIELRNNQIKNAELLALPGNSPQRVGTPVSSEPTEILASIKSESTMLPKPKGKFFRFDVSDTEGKPLSTFIHNVDLQRGREIASYEAGSYVDIVHNRNDVPLTLTCGVFGYKLADKVINYNDPSSTPGAYRDEHGAWVIPYLLEPLVKGDVSVMYNVRFYKDAVVMLPNSRYELNQLIELMQLNPGYVIRVHAHCNGKKARKIIALGHPKNYFDINGSLEFSGTAKQLTGLRADAIRTYLIKNGIEPERIKTYSWGGSYMLVNETNPHAKLNDRIEIEILKD